PGAVGARPTRRVGGHTVTPRYSSTASSTSCSLYIGWINTRAAVPSARTNTVSGSTGGAPRIPGSSSSWSETDTSWSMPSASSVSNPLVSDGSVWETTTRTRSPSASAASWMAGSSRRHGSHQYAHMVTPIGSPAWILPSVVVAPSFLQRTMSPATGPSVVAAAAPSRHSGRSAVARVASSTTVTGSSAGGSPTGGASWGDSDEAGSSP